MCLPDGEKINRLSSKQRFKSRCKIHQHPERDLPDGLALRKIFRKHDHIVPEVQKYFSLVSLRQCSTAYMVDLGSGTGINLISQQLQSPAKINFLHMGKEISIETFCLMK